MPSSCGGSVSNRWPIILLAALLAVPTALSNPVLAQVQEQKAEIPGAFFEQWQRIKTNGMSDVPPPPNGRRPLIPAGLQRSWFDADAADKADRDQFIRTENLFRRDSNSKSTGVAAATFVGPHIAGRTRALLVDRSNPNRIFAGAASGGLWYSADAAEHWQPIDDQAMSLSVMDICQHPVNPKRIYYCTGEPWRDGIDGGIPGAGIFESFDGGRHFLPVGPTSRWDAFRFCWCIDVGVHRDIEAIYVGTNTGGLMRSITGGLCWDCVLADGCSVTDVIVFDDGSVLAGWAGHGLYYSHSGERGSFYPAAPACNLPQFDRIVFARCPSNPCCVYAAFGQPNGVRGLAAMLFSPDGGAELGSTRRIRDWR